MIDRYVNQTRTYKNFENISSIELNETSRASGYDYITLFVDLNKRRIIFITKSKDTNTIKDFVDDLEVYKGKASNIKKISVDMSVAFKKEIKENLKDVSVVYDKFHLIKHINDSVMKLEK